MRYSSVIKSFLSLCVFVFFATSLLSYNPNDPSLDNVTSLAVKNFAGKPGAYFADLIIQLFGFAYIVLLMIPLGWSFVYLRVGAVSYWFLRVLAGIIALFSASLLFSSGAIFELLIANIKILSIDVFITKLSSFAVLVTSLYFALALPNSVWASFFAKLTDFKITLPKFSIKSEPIMQKIAPIAKGVKTAKITPSFQANEELPEIIEPMRKVSTKPAYVYEPIKGKFALPSTELLKEIVINKDIIGQNNAVIKKHKEELQQVLTDFGVSGEMLGAYAGPVVTLYELEPAAGTKSSRVIGLADDISRSMRAISARIAVIPGRNALGIELPNKQRETVYLRELLESAEYRNKGYDLPIILGKDIAGNVVVADLAKMPHLLVAGTTGSGKSVAINTMILSLVYSLTPQQCKFIMVDPKMLELSVYDNIPHLLTNVVTEPGKAVVALKWVVKEMENRYRLMSNLGVRNIHNYNERIKEAIAKGETMHRTIQTGFDSETGKPKIEQVPLDMEILPFIVVIVDEMADLMIVAGKEIETSIQRLAQMARAAGIHIIMATQRPSVDVITGVIKANFPTRISFQVTSKIDSRTILGEQGAEQLLGKGDMLYMAGGSKITRIHGPFVADSEVEKVVSYLKAQGEPDYINDVTTEDGSNSSIGSTQEYSAEEDELYRQAIEIVAMEGKASTSFIQRCLKIGYNRAANIMDKMEKEGLVGKPNHVGKREILM